MIFEICTDSVLGAVAAQKYNAKRIELCSALSVGGLTPSVGLVKNCIFYAPNVEIHPMIRHREGGFQYDKKDVEIMKKDIKVMSEFGVKGVVFGVLNNSFEISEYNKELVDIAKENQLEVTFHRAFDFVKKSEKALEKLIHLKVDRLLTSGGEPTAIQGIRNICKWQKEYGEHIQIMAGSGVNASNALQIADCGVQNLHFTAKKIVGDTNLSMGSETVVDEEKILQITSLFR